ncbi:MAG: hypothetical protein ACHQX1_02865 [Candidatus Micrarchaeales archaeon]
MFSKVGFAALALVVFSAFTSISAAGSQSVFNNLYCATSGVSTGTLSDCINSTIPYVVIALMLSFTMVAFAYLIGEVFGIQSFKGWYKGELWEAIKSLLIVGVVFSAIVIFGEIAALLPGGPANIPNGSTTGLDFLYTQAYAYLDGTSTVPGAVNLTNESFNNLLGSSVGSEYLKSITLNTYFTIPFPPVPVPTVPVFGSFNLGTDFNVFQSEVIDSSITGPASIEKDTLGYLVFPMMLVLGAQLFLFVTLIPIGLGILLPLGLIFRATPFLRSIGGTLIALAIAVIIVYPALLAIFNAPITLFFSPLYPNGAATQTQGCASVLTFCAVYQTFLNPETLLFSGLPQNPNENDYAAFTAGNIGASDAFFNGNMSAFLSPFFAYMVPVIIQFILLVMDLIIGIVMAMNIATALGGNIRLGIGKLKLA